MFEAVIFDFDGVILDSEPIHYEACCNVFKKLGLTLTYQGYIDQYLGLSDKEMFLQFLISKGHHLGPEEIISLVNTKIEGYTNIYAKDDSDISS